MTDIKLEAFHCCLHHKSGSLLWNCTWDYLAVSIRLLLNSQLSIDSQINYLPVISCGFAWLVNNQKKKNYENGNHHFLNFAFHYWTKSLIGITLTLRNSSYPTQFIYLSINYVSFDSTSSLSNCLLWLKLTFKMSQAYEDFAQYHCLACMNNNDYVLESIIIISYLGLDYAFKNMIKM